MQSAIYTGQTIHSRSRPKRHTLRYRLFMLHLDLDELTTLDKSLRWFSLDRFNLTSFYARDHGDGSDTPLRAQVERHLDAAGLTIAGGPIRLLSLPRMLGYVFNPLSVYFCYTPQGSLRAILYEVNSTFGERHSYLMPAEPDAYGVVRQSAAKRLHVSPFMDMDLTYAFQVSPPDEAVHVGINAADADGTVLSASFSADRQPLTDAGLLAVWVAHPLLTLKVILAIHWEAIKIFSKGLRLRTGTPVPADPVSLGVQANPADRRRPNAV